MVVHDLNDWEVEVNGVSGHAPKSCQIYPLVIEYSYWTWPFIVNFAIKNADFPWLCRCLPEGTYWWWQPVTISWHHSGTGGSTIWNNPIRGGRGLQMSGPRVTTIRDPKSELILEVITIVTPKYMNYLARSLKYSRHLGIGAITPVFIVVLPRPRNVLSHSNGPP